MPITATCPSCGFGSHPPAHLVGSSIRCPRCQTSFLITGETSSHGKPAQAHRPHPHGRSHPPLTASELPDYQADAPTPGEEKIPDISGPQLAGLAGSFLLLVGVFTPMISVPVVGNLNYIQNGMVDGVLVLMLAGLSAFLALSKNYRGLWGTGLGAIALLSFTFASIQVRLSQARTTLHQELAGNPYGAAEGAFRVIQVQWGWTLLILGASLVITAAISAEVQRNPQLSNRIKIVSAIAVPMTILFSILVACLIPVTFQWAHDLAIKREAAERIAQAEAEKAAQEAVERQVAQEEMVRKSREQAVQLQAEHQAAEREVAKEREFGNVTRQQVVPLDAPDKAPAPVPGGSDWADASIYAVQQDDFRLQVKELKLREKRLQFTLLIENVGETKELPFQSWGTAKKGVPRLSDNFGHIYPKSLIEPAPTSVEPPNPSPSIPPGQHLTDVLAFEGSLDSVQSLRLELPASAFKGYGLLRLQIPKVMIVLKTARSLGEKAVPDLLEVARSKDFKNRRTALAVLSDLGPKAAAAVPELARLLSDADSKFRVAVLATLRKTGPSAKGALAEILHTVGDSDKLVSRAALDTLKQLGPPSPADLPVLVVTLKDQNASVRLWIIQALEQMGAQAKAAIPALGEALHDHDPAVRARAAIALGELGAEAAASIPDLIRALKDTEREARGNAIQALEKIGLNEEGVLALIETTRNEDPETAGSAAAVLGKPGRLGKGQVPALVEALKSGKPNAKSFAVSALGALGPDAERAVPALLATLKDKDEKTRQGSALALGKIGAKAWSAAADLGNALEDQDPGVRKNACIALGQLGAEARRMVPKLIRAFRDKDLHNEAAVALVKIGKDSIPDLVETLEGEKNFEVRLEYIDLLAKFGNEGEGAIPALTAVSMNDRFPGVRKAAKDALEKIQRKPK